MKKFALYIALGTLALAAPSLVRAEAPADKPAPKKEAKGKGKKGEGKKDEPKKDEPKKDEPAKGGGGW